MAGKKADDDRDGLTDITPVGVVGFCSVWEPKQFRAAPGSKPKDPQYRIALVFPEGTDISGLKKIVQRAAIKKWGKDEAKELHEDGELMLPFNKGGPRSKYGKKYGAPYDMDKSIYINAASSSAPGVVNERSKPMLNQQDFYSGCEARISVYAHAYDTLGNKGVTFFLNNVQRTSKGDGRLLSGKRSAEDEFGAYADEDADDDDDDFLN